MKPYPHGAWPALMRKQTAAAYLDVSIAEFEGMVARDEMPASIRIGRRQSWSKQAIDGAIAIMTGADPSVSVEEEDDWRSRLPIYANYTEDMKWWKKR